MVNPAFTSPTKMPRFLFPTSSRTKITDNVMIPAPPVPVTILPKMSTQNERAKAVTTPPTAKHPPSGRTRFRGGKIVARRPINGASEAMLMRYEPVNHMAPS